MREIINGKLYDTDTATRIWKHEYGIPGDDEYFSETLYQKESGELFLYGEGGAKSPYSEEVEDRLWEPGAAIISEQAFNAKEWVSRFCDASTYIKLFSPVPE